MSEKQEGDPGDEVAPRDEALDPDEVGAGGETPGTATFELVEAGYRGPLPPPSMLDDYNSVIPGLAERIVRMAESDQRHYQVMERRVVQLRFTGQGAALLIALAGLLIGAWLIDRGNNIEGLAALFLGLGPVLGAFLYRQVKTGGSPSKETGQ